MSDWTTAGRKIHDLVEVEMKRNSALSYIDAMTLVRQKHPELFEEYQNINRVLDTYPAIIDTPPRRIPVGYVMGHPDFKDPHGRINISRNPVVPEGVSKFYLVPQDSDHDRSIREEFHKRVVAFMEDTGEEEYERTITHIKGGTNMVDYNNDSEGKKLIRDEVDRKVRAYMAEHPEVSDYERAMTLVFSLHPALKEKYAKS